MLATLAALDGLPDALCISLMCADGPLLPPLALRPDDFIVARFGYADCPLLKIF